MENKTRGMRSSRFQSPNTLPPPDVDGVITLAQVRPQPRPQNEYVDTPRSPLVSSGRGLGNKNSVSNNLVIRERVLLPSRTSSPSIIRSQPSSKSPPLKKDLPLEVEDGEDSIICSNCGKCKCGQCTLPKELPSKWLCGDQVKLSPETIIEYCTCMCCVKGIFYHTKDDQDSEYEPDTDPCACCNRPHCCARWTCMLAMSLCLPCMCLYIPARCGLMGCTAVYNKCRKKGCTCKSETKNKSKTTRSKLDPSSQYRGLLIESDRESSSISNS